MSASILISTCNESQNIESCIRSAWHLTEDILVLDMGSTDDTVRRSQGLGARVLSVAACGYVEPMRKFGIKESRGDWVFILDADERMTPQLATEINQTLSVTSSDAPTHFAVPRKNIFGRKWLRYGGWYPDYQIRLIRRSALTDWPARIHATPQVQGTRGTLASPIEHYFHGNLTQMVEKTTKYEMIEAELLYEAHRETGTITFFRKYLGELFRRLIRHQGWRDGMMGVIESIYQAYSKTITYLYLYERYLTQDQTK